MLTKHRGRHGTITRLPSRQRTTCLSATSMTVEWLVLHSSTTLPAWRGRCSSRPNGMQRQCLRRWRAAVVTSPPVDLDPPPPCRRHQAGRCSGDPGSGRSRLDLRLANASARSTLACGLIGEPADATSSHRKMPLRALIARPPPCWASGTCSPEALIAIQRWLRHTGSCKMRPIACTRSSPETILPGPREWCSHVLANPMEATQSSFVRCAPTGLLKSPQQQLWEIVFILCSAVSSAARLTGSAPFTTSSVTPGADTGSISPTSALPGGLKTDSTAVSQRCALATEIFGVNAARSIVGEAPDLRALLLSPAASRSSARQNVGSKNLLRPPLDSCLLSRVV